MSCLQIDIKYFFAISVVIKIIRFRRSEYSYKALLSITPGEIKI